MKYNKIKFNPTRMEQKPIVEEISQEEFYKLCESNDSYFLSHAKDENGKVVISQVHVTDIHWKQVE